MKRTFTPLGSKEQTGRDMYRLIDTYANDINNTYYSYNGQPVPLGQLDFHTYFDLIRNIPYAIDSQPVEQIQRPAFTIDGSQDIDCKKKAILICAWFKCHDVPYRLATSSSRPDGQIHHVFPQFYHDGKWINADATYSHYEIADPKKVTNFQILPGRGVRLGFVGAIISGAVGITGGIMKGVQNRKNRRQMAMNNYTALINNQIQSKTKVAQTEKIMMYGGAIVLLLVVLKQRSSDGRKK